MAKKYKSHYSKRIRNKIIKLISGSEYGLKRICEENDDIPCESTIHRWLDENRYPDFSEQYARANIRRADNQFDNILDIADSNLAVDEKRVRIDARKWTASKLNMKKYGDRQTIDLQTPQGIQISVADQTSKELFDKT